MYLDSHAHLDGPRFAADREAMIERAWQAGVRLLLAIGNGDGPEEMDCALPFAERSPWIYASAGVHPHEARLLEPAHLDRLAALASHPKLLAIGELGLDYHYDHSPRELQQRALRQQLEVAISVAKPILIHCRPSQNSSNAFDDLFRILDETGWPARGLGGVMHCFSGSPVEASAALDRGLLLSFSGNITYPGALSIREAARGVPLDRFLLETDCPYLAPVPYRGGRNEPAYVIETTRYFAQLRHLEPETAGRQSLANFRALFHLPAD